MNFLDNPIHREIDIVSIQEGYSFRKILKPRIRTVVGKYHDNSVNLKSEVQYKLNGCNVSWENGTGRGRNNLHRYNLDHNEIFKKQVIKNTKILPRRIPNILKNSPRKQKVIRKSSNETCFVNMKENIEETYNSITALDSSSAEKSYLNDANICKIPPHRRKQEHDFMGILQKSPNWDIHTFVDVKKEIKNCKNKACALKTKKQEENSLLSVSHEMFTEFMTQNFPSGECESTDLLDFIDFSSNEIFSSFAFTEYARYSDKLWDSSRTICDSEIFDKQYDINNNDVDADVMQYSTLSECWNKDDKKQNCLSNLYCNYCQEDCAAHWLAISEEKNMLFVKSRFINNSKINCQAKFDSSSLPVTKVNINSTNESVNAEHKKDNLHLTTPNIFDICTFNEKCNTNNSYLLNKDHTESNSYVDVPNMSEVVLQYTLEDIEDGILKEPTEMKNEECSMNNNINNDFLHQFDLTIPVPESKKMDAFLAQECTKHRNDDEFQCLLCPLTFYSARTMAMHQAGAHGGMYVILCESCGRLFNRKYNFNRHFIHCCRLKEPYKCDMCTRYYRHKSSLMHHLKVAHDVQYATNRSTTYTCSICKKIYLKFGALENHMKRHKNN